jgi:hypothetical protein
MQSRVEEYAAAQERAALQLLLPGLEAEPEPTMSRVLLIALRVPCAECGADAGDWCRDDWRLHGPRLEPVVAAWRLGYRDAARDSRYRRASKPVEVVRLSEAARGLL